MQFHWILWNQKVQYHVHTSSPFVSLMSLFITVHASHPVFVKIPYEIVYIRESHTATEIVLYGIATRARAILLDKVRYR
jgi:hypothetical protein